MRSIAQQLARIDLNLLATLLILLEENNVSRAADKLFISQPAVSKALQKLRIIFNDPLFIRESNGLRPTVRAQQIKQPLTLLLSQIHGLLEEEDFNVVDCEQSFVISIPSLMSQSLLLPIIDLIAKQAPEIVISQHPSSIEQEKHLASGALDFSIYVKPATGEQFDSTLLGHASPAIFARNDHPLTKLKKVKIEDCLNYKFVDFSLDSHADIDIENPALKFIEEMQIERQVALRSGQLGLLAQTMKSNDYLLIGAHYLMSNSLFYEDFTRVYLFNEEKYRVATYLNDHSITHNSRAHQWLKQLIIDKTSKLINNKD